MPGEKKFPPWGDENLWQVLYMMFKWEKLNGEKIQYDFSIKDYDDVNIGCIEIFCQSYMAMPCI